MKAILKIQDVYRIVIPNVTTTYSLVGIIYHQHTMIFHKMNPDHMEFDNGVYISTYTHKTFGIIASFSTKYRKERFK